MRLATVEQSKRIDEDSQKECLLTSEILMEAAGALAAREIDLSFLPELRRGTTTIVVGPGNNGGDALVVARHLHSIGHRDLQVVLFGNESKESDLFRLQRQRVERQGVALQRVGPFEKLTAQLSGSSLIVDGLFGVGLSRAVEGTMAKAIDAMNSSRATVVSLDAPSGLDCDRGRVEGAVVKAAMTLTFGLAKPGFFVGVGPSKVGQLKILPIGFAPEVLRRVAGTHFLFTEKLARRYLPGRSNLTNKSDFGRLLVLAGNEGMWGAGVLAASAAYRLGAGYVTWASWNEPASHLDEAPEVLSSTWEKVKDTLKSGATRAPTAVVIGPGLGSGDQLKEALVFLKNEYEGPVIVDADAITVCVHEDLFPLPGNWVMTPHSGELSRILGKEAARIDKDRFRSALEASEKTGTHVLLKGYRSVVAYKDRCMVINSGNSALAKAGTGDVLAGMIGALAAQGLEVLQATATATYVHGRMADDWVRSGKDQRALVASDLKEALPSLISRLRGGALGK